MLFAFAAVPLIGLLGGAVDVTRQHRYKSEILNAMDATAIALVRKAPTNDADADAFVNDYITPMLPGYGSDPMLHIAASTREDRRRLPRRRPTATWSTAFLPVVGIQRRCRSTSRPR